MASPMRERIEAANAQAVGRITSADPVLIDIAPAGEVIPGLVGWMILHSGPPMQAPRCAPHIRDQPTGGPE